MLIEESRKTLEVIDNVLSGRFGEETVEAGQEFKPLPKEKREIYRLAKHLRHQVGVLRLRVQEAEAAKIAHPLVSSLLTTLPKGKEELVIDFAGVAQVLDNIPDDQLHTLPYAFKNIHEMLQNLNLTYARLDQLRKPYADHVQLANTVEVKKPQSLPVAAPHKAQLGGAVIGRCLTETDLAGIKSLIANVKDTLNYIGFSQWPHFESGGLKDSVEHDFRQYCLTVSSIVEKNSWMQDIPQINSFGEFAAKLLAKLMQADEAASHSNQQVNEHPSMPVVPVTSDSEDEHDYAELDANTLEVSYGDKRVADYKPVRLSQSRQTVTGKRVSSAMPSKDQFELKDLALVGAFAEQADRQAKSYSEHELSNWLDDVLARELDCITAFKVRGIEVFWTSLDQQITRVQDKIKQGELAERDLVIAFAQQMDDYAETKEYGDYFTTIGELDSFMSELCDLVRAYQPQATEVPMLPTVAARLGQSAVTSNHGFDDEDIRKAIEASLQPH